MIINFPFPEDSDAKSYPEIKGYLKQLELVIHHAQKAVENAERDGLKLSEDAYVCWEHPSLEYDGSDESLKDFTVNYYEDLQRIELKLNLQ